MIINLKDITKTYSGTTVLENINLQIEDDSRIGLIGSNGCGKTTLLNIIAGILPYDSGEIIKSGKKIGYLKQNQIFESDNTILKEMQSVFKDILEMEKKLTLLYNEIASARDEKVLKDLNKKYANLQTEFENKDGYNINVKINTVLNGMGFNDKDYDMPISLMSGGEKVRLSICRLLLSEPDLLILDEPTNHLDFKTLKWLEDYLASYKGAILMVSHDRYFLDKTATQICEIYKTHLKSYSGNYSSFIRLKKDMLSFLTKEYEKQQNQIQSLKDYITKNKVRASTAKSAKSRENTLNNLKIIENPKEYLKNIKLNFEYDYEPSFELLSVNNLSVKSGETNIISDIDFTMYRGDKIAIVGDNGVGKTTFLKALLDIIPFSGAVSWGKNIKLSYYEQENFTLNEKNTVLNEIMEKTNASTELEVRNLLGSLLISNEDVYKPIGVLSGGEKAKIKFAIMMLTRGNVLILDEPTNHLDLSAKDVFDDSMYAFKGTLLMVSHDRYLLNKVPTKIAELTKNGFVIYEGKYDDYINNKITVKEEKKEKSQTKEKDIFYKSKKYRSQQVRKQKLIQSAEKDIEELENKIKLTEEEIASPETASNHTILLEKCNLLEELKNQLNDKYALWEKYNNE